LEVGQKIVGRFEPLGKFGQSVGKGFAPKVSVAVANDPTWHTGDPRVPAIAIPNLTALVDTGSDVSRIDLEMAHRLGLKQVGELSSSFTGIVSKTPIFDVQLVFLEALFVVGGPVTAISLRAQDNFHDVILGWDVLQYFDLRICSKRQTVEMIFVGI
jgi:hypothetical protein